MPKGGDKGGRKPKLPPNEKRKAVSCATAMAAAHGKEIKEWFSNRSTIDLIEALALEIKEGISPDSGNA